MPNGSVKKLTMNPDELTALLAQSVEEAIRNKGLYTFSSIEDKKKERKKTRKIKSESIMVKAECTFNIEYWSISLDDAGVEYLWTSNFIAGKHPVILIFKFVQRIFLN